MKSTKTKSTNKEESCCCSSDITDEKRNAMIAEAAYFRAEQRDFTGDDEHRCCDWLEAEAEIDSLLEQKLEPSNTSKD